MQFSKKLRFVTMLGIFLAFSYTQVTAQTYTGLQEKLITTLIFEYPKTINLHLANLKKAPTTLSVMALDGKLWYEELIKEQNGYGKKLNFKKLPIGFYYLLLKHEEQETRYYFTIDRKQLDFFPPKSFQKKDLTYHKNRSKS